MGEGGADGVHAPVQEGGGGVVVSGVLQAGQEGTGGVGSLEEEREGHVDTGGQDAEEGNIPFLSLPLALAICAVPIQPFIYRVADGCQRSYHLRYTLP